MEKKERKSGWKQQYQKRKGYFKEYYQKHKDVMDANNKKNAKKYREEYKHLKEENKKLNIKVASLEGEIKGLNYTIDKLKEENQTLELWLDNKEKLNEEYRKEIKGLKSDLGECECSFGFESDEVGFWKREYKRLKKWIKDHCKGYGNLFPEDEMKRQWKKADKKRKLKGMLMEEDTLQELRDLGKI